MASALPLEVICVGETLVDFLPTRPGCRVAEVESWIPCPGGSPANVAVGLARLGIRSGMLGVVGDDEFGLFLKSALQREGVDVSHLRQTREGPTGLVFISLSESGERSFTFFRNRSAEIFLGEVDVDLRFVREARVLHLGTNSLLLPEAQRASLSLAAEVQAAGGIVSCDPNLRLHFWPDPRELRSVIDRLLPLCAVLKLSDEETAFVTGEQEPERALRYLASRGIQLPIVTHGPEGASFLWKGALRRVTAPRAHVVDTTGAGDGFVAALLGGIAKHFPNAATLRQASADALADLASFACLCAARVVEHRGAVHGLPRLEEVKDFLPTLPPARGASSGD